jgi:hypothetical protein
MTARILQILTHAAGAQSAQLTTEGNSHGDEHGIAGPDRNVGSDSHGIDKAS